MHIRRFNVGDEPSLWRVYNSAIHRIAALDYTPEQIQAWAPADMDMALWAQHMRAIRPFVAEIEGVVVGYADVQQHGYIDHFFVAGTHARQGIGRQLMQRIHTQAMSLGLTTLTAHVSKTAEPFFAHHGFDVVERRLPMLRGVTVQNAWMRKALGTD